MQNGTPNFRRVVMILPDPSINDVTVTATTSKLMVLGLDAEANMVSRLWDVVESLSRRIDVRDKQLGEAITQRDQYIAKAAIYDLGKSRK